MTPGSDAGIAVHLIINELLARFHFCSLMVIRMLSGTVWELILGAFWRPWAPFWWFGRVLGTGQNLDGFLDPPRGDPGLRHQPPEVVTSRFLAPGNHQSLIAKSLIL